MTFYEWLQSQGCSKELLDWLRQNNFTDDPEAAWKTMSNGYWMWELLDTLGVLPNCKKHKNYRIPIRVWSKLGVSCSPNSKCPQCEMLEAVWGRNYVFYGYYGIKPEKVRRLYPDFPV